MYRLCLIILLFCVTEELAGQPIFFEKSFGGPDSEIARAVREFPDGTIMVAGIRENGPHGGFDFALSRLNRNGQVVWTKFYGTTADDQCLYMTKCSDGNLILAGETYTTTGMLDAFFIKIDTAGNELWNRVVGTPLNESVRFISSTSDHGFVCAGFQNDALGSNDSWFLKLDSVGDVIWSQAYGAWSTEYADMIHELPDGRFIATGDTRSIGNGGYDVELFLLDEGGIPEFDFTYGDAFQNGCQGVIPLHDGNFLSFGETEIYTNSSYEIFLEKIDSAGTSKWRRTFGGNGTDAAFSVCEMQDGSFMMTGYSTSVGSGPLNLVVAKADASGNLQWMRPYGSIGIDIGYDIQPAMDGGFLIAGRTAPSDDQYYVLHVADNGLLNGEKQIEISKASSVYPNPSSGRFTVRSEKDINTVVVVDMQGRKIYESSPGISSFNIDLGIASNGIYKVILTSDLTVECGQIVVIQ